MGYKILVYHIVKPDFSTELKPYSDFQTVAGRSLPKYYTLNDKIKTASLAGVGSVLEVELSDDLSEVVAIVSKHVETDWLFHEINELVRENEEYSRSKKDIPKMNSVKIPRNLYIDKKTWDFIVAAVQLNKYPLIIGPKGCGKTECAYAVAEALGYDFFPINCGALFKPTKALVGSLQASDGSTYMVDSEFMAKFTSDKPTIIFLDELSRIPAQAANYMMTILDRKQSYIYIEDKGIRVYKGPDVVFIAAANFGIEYTDSRRQDDAFMDRFIKFYVDYLSEKMEVELVLDRVKNIDQKSAEELTKIVRRCRQNKDLGMAVSTRQLLDMADFVSTGFTVDNVVDNILINMFINGSDDRRAEAENFLNAKR